MVEVVIDDEIRGGREAIRLHEDHTVARTIGRLVERFGLPARSLDGRDLTYRLSAPGPAGDPVELGDAEIIGQLDLVDGERLVLSSPDATEALVQIGDLVGQVEAELRVQGGTWKDEITGEIRADVATRLTALRSEIDREARGLLRGAVAKLPLRRRWRARRLMGQVAGTGVAPEEVAGVRVGISELSSAVSHVWRVAPFVVGATVATGGAAAVEVFDDDVSGAEVTELQQTLTELEGQLTAEALTAEPLTVEDIDIVVRAALDDALADGVALPPGFADELSIALRQLIRDEVPDAEQDGVTANALGRLNRDSPIRALEPGDTLWSVALDVRADPEGSGCDPGPFAESTAAYVRRIWAANAGALGGDPDAVDPVEELRVPCPE